MQSGSRISLSGSTSSRPDAVTRVIVETMHSAVVVRNLLERNVGFIVDLMVKVNAEVDSETT